MCQQAFCNVSFSQLLKSAFCSQLFEFRGDRADFLGLVVETEEARFNHGNGLGLIAFGQLLCQGKVEALYLRKGRPYNDGVGVATLRNKINDGVFHDNPHPPNIELRPPMRSQKLNAGLMGDCQDGVIGEVTPVVDVINSNFHRGLMVELCGGFYFEIHRAQPRSSSQNDHFFLKIGAPGMEFHTTKGPAPENRTLFLR